VKKNDEIIRLDDSEEENGPQQSVQIGGKKMAIEGRKSDTCIIHDTTGSMEDIISAMIELCEDFVDELAERELKPFFSLIAFGDIKPSGSTDTIEVVIHPTGNIKETRNGLRDMPSNWGYANEGESSLEAFELMFEQIRFRPAAVRSVLFITDEPAHQHSVTAEEIIEELVDREIIVFVISPDIDYYRKMASETGGTWRNVRPPSNMTLKTYAKQLVSEMAKKIAKTVDEVYRLGGGDVTRYLALKPPEDD